jgi:hypothetical protein
LLHDIKAKVNTSSWVPFWTDTVCILRVNSLRV